VQASAVAADVPSLVIPGATAVSVARQRPIDKLRVRETTPALTRSGRRRVRPGREERVRLLRQERIRMARELHDVVGQSLTALIVQVRVACARGEADLTALRLFEVAAQQALDGVRTSVYGLRRSSREPLEDARELSERLTDGSGCRLTWLDERQDTGTARRVSEQVAAAVTEAVANIVRHAGAENALVRLRLVGDRIQVSIEDDGVGFIPDAITPTPDGRGLGLVGMKERLWKVGGSINIRSAPGEGTTVIVEADRFSVDPPAVMRPAAAG
jgi:signal transduction histidine kinase